MKKCFFEALAGIIAIVMCGARAFGATEWTGGGGTDTLTSTQENWLNGRADDNTEPMHFNKSAVGKTVTFDRNYTVNGYIWVGEFEAPWTFVTEVEPEPEAEPEPEPEPGVDGSEPGVGGGDGTGTGSTVEAGPRLVPNPVVFEAKDGSSSWGFSATTHLGIGDNPGQRGALLIKSGTYHVGGDVIVGLATIDNGNTKAFLTMEGGTLSADFWLAAGRGAPTNDTDITVSHIKICEGATLKIGQGEAHNGMIDLSGSGTFTVEGGRVEAPGSKNGEADNGTALAIANLPGATNDVIFTNGEMLLGGLVNIGREGTGSFTMGGTDSHNKPVLATTGIVSGTGNAALQLNWGTIYATATNNEFIAKNVPWSVGGNPAITTGFPISIPTAPDGEGNITVTVTNEEGSVVIPLSDHVLYHPGTGTSMHEANGFASFYSNTKYVWTDSKQTPNTNADVIIPAGVTIDFTPTATNTFKSLRIDGTLILRSEGEYPIITSKSGLNIAGTGTFALPSNTKLIYQDLALNLDEAMTLLIYRTMGEVQSIENEDFLLKTAGSSRIIESQVKISYSRRPVTIEFVEETVEGESAARGRKVFHWGALPPDWTNIITRKGQIAWDAPVTISGDDDISQEGTFVDGYFHNYSTEPGFRGATYSLRGVTLRRFYSTSDWHDTLIPVNATGAAFALGNSRTANTVDTLANASAGFRYVVAGGLRCNNGGNGGAMDLTIHGLVDGHAYLVQMFCMNETISGDAAATMYVGTTNSTSIVEGDVAVKVNADANNGEHPGQYIIGRFVADGDTQTFRIKAYNSAVARENMILWREITKDVNWDGGTNVWNFSGQNWEGYSADYTIWTNSVVGYAHTAVATGPVQLSVNGQVYASSVKLADGAELVVPSGSNHLTVASDITATTNASFTVQGNLTYGGNVVMNGYGEFHVNAPSANRMEVASGNIVRTASTTPTRLTFSETPLYGDETAKAKGYHALYSATGDITLSSVSGSGNITADNNGVLTINNSTDCVYAGHMRAKTFTKTGSGTLKIIGESDIDTTYNINGGTVALAKPSDIAGFTYDFDATAEGTVETDGENVTRWNDSAGSETYYLAPRESDSYVDATYEAPRFVSGDETIFGGRSALVSDKFRMDGNATEYQSTVFAVMQLTGEEVGSPRLLVDASELGSAATDPYRIRVSIKDGHPTYYNIFGNESPADSAWLSLNDKYGTDATFELNTPYVLCVPWHWGRLTGNNDNGGWRISAYGWGAPMAWGEIVAYSRALAIEEKNAVNEYLMRKWGIGTGGYKPFGNAAVVVGKSGTLDATGQELTIKSLDVSGILMNMAGVTVLGDVTFKPGTKIYLDEADAINGIMTVNGSLNGRGNVTFYVKGANGKYKRTRSYSVDRDPDTHKLVFTKTGFTIRIQ